MFFWNFERALSGYVVFLLIDGSFWIAIQHHKAMAIFALK